MAPGTVVATRYLVERELGRGGMATVLEVKDLRTDRRLALKILKPEIAAHPEAVERFRREGEFLQSLRHPALITVDAIGSLPDGRLFLAMELLRGETLGERIRRGRLSPTEVSPILAGAAVGLDAAHRAGVVHRDLKPDNVFLSQGAGGGPVQMKLLDFGISKIDGRASLTRTGQVLGTPRYMAPEQLRGEEDLDARVDVYALGVILYEALAGAPAFPAQQPSDLIVAILHGRVTPLRAMRPDLSPELEAVVMRAMSKTREARFGSAIELAEAWFEVVHRHDGPKGVRTGVATNVLGSIMESLPPGSPYTTQELRPATFREFEARLPPLAALPKPMPLALAASPGMATPETTSPAHLPAPIAAPPAAGPVLKTTLSPKRVEAMPVMDAQAASRAAEAQKIASIPPSPARAELDEPVLPTRGRGPLIALGVLAFVGVVAGGWLWLGRGDERAPTTGGRYLTVPLVMPDAGLASAVVVVLDAGVALDASLDKPDAGLRELPSEVEEREHGAHHGTTTRPALNDPWVSTGMDEPVATAPTNDPNRLVAEARDASRSGDARRCIELATEAIAAGANASVYVIRGDCYRALGDSAHALRSYQRFCTIAPNSSQIETARRYAAELGGSCP